MGVGIIFAAEILTVYRTDGGRFTDKRGHLSEMFGAVEPFELILSYEIVVTSRETLAEFLSPIKRRWLAD